MELSDAVEKASEALKTPPLALMATPRGVKFTESPVPSEGTYDYLTEIKPFIEKWGFIVGEKILDAAKRRDRFANRETTDEEDDAAIEEYGQIFRSHGCDVAAGVFALGYLLGDPQYDRKKHNKHTLDEAIRDRDTHRVLTTRFTPVQDLRERFYGYIDGGAQIISMAYREMNVPHTEENVREWGMLASSFGFFDAFRLGLQVRRVMEEAMEFDQIARNLES